jgi:tetratricopeptide (TPR) repeat protein
MARAQAQRRRKARSHAQKSARSVEDLMFFPKLRRRAKWVFLLLALAFGLGFVVFGVGTGVSGTSIGDILQEIIGQRSNTTSIDDARKKALANPRDADAQLAYANALQDSGETRAAITALERYTTLRPRDTDTLRQLASLWGSVAAKARQDYDAARVEAEQVSAAQTFAQPSGDFLKQIEQNAIAQSLVDQANARASAAQAEAQSAATEQQNVYEKLTTLVPDDPSLLLSLGISAQQAGDLQAAIDAYKRFLVLAPDDPSADQVKQEIKLLEQSQKANSLLQPSG